MHCDTRRPFILAIPEPKLDGAARAQRVREAAHARDDDAVDGLEAHPRAQRAVARRVRRAARRDAPHKDLAAARAERDAERAPALHRHVERAIRATRIAVHVGERERHGAARVAQRNAHPLVPFFYVAVDLAELEAHVERAAGGLGRSRREAVGVDGAHDGRAAAVLEPETQRALLAHLEVEEGVRLRLVAVVQQ